MLIAGKLLAGLSVALIFLAYSNFAPTALSSDLIADYVKNHFMREIIFGLFLATVTIVLIIRANTRNAIPQILVGGSVVILPFWIAFLFGWSTGGMTDVWGDSIDANAAYMLHGTQMVGFYLGLALMWMGLSKP